MTKKPKDGPNKLRPDVAETAHRTMLEAIGEAPKTIPGDRPKNTEAVRRGKLGGAKGGRARAKALSPEERSRISKQAAKSRWTDEDD